MKTIDVTEEETDQNKERLEFKTFPVPFSLEKIKEKITITTNTPSKPSKEKIINQAFKFHSQGNISEAAKYYQHFINQGFKDHRVFSNYGAILKDLGKLEDAEFSTRKAIEIKPDYTEAHFNYGAILKDLGKFKEAEISYRKAIELDPSFGKAYFNLGNILKASSTKLDEALYNFQKAQEHKMDKKQCLAGIGKVLLNQGKHKEGIEKIRKGEGAIIFDLNNGFSID